MAVSLITITRQHGVTLAIFAVSLPDRKPVYMCVRTTPYENEHRGMVIVDAKKFLALWRAEPANSHSQLAHGTPNTWRADYKFPAATEGFAEGFANPVPLAQIVYTEEAHTTISHRFLWFGRQALTEQFQYLSFINGITRTIWLLSHGCEAFPIECPMPAALKLHRAAGLEDTRVFTLHDRGTRDACRGGFFACKRRLGKSR